MKKKLLALALAAVLAVGAFTGCGSSTKDQTSEENTQKSGVDTQAEVKNDTVIRVGGLKGPTSMGLAKLLDDATNKKSDLNIEFTMAAAADELTPSFIQGNLDIMAVPSNLASVLYNKTNGEAQVLAVNTLGVLYVVDKGESVSSIADLKGKTIMATGQGATPEYCLKYLLQQNGLDPEKDVTIEWKSEPTEIVAAMAQSTEETIAMLPQPFVTVAQSKVEGLNVAIDLNKEWNNLNNGSSLITGVVVVRKAFAQENPELISAFLEEYKASIEYANSNVEETAALIEGLGIVEKAAIAQKALPQCNIAYMDGTEMKTALSGYLQILSDQDAKSVGGKLPADDFYYNAK